MKTMKKTVSVLFLTLMLGALSLSAGCKGGPNLELGGAYAPATNNAAGVLVASAPPEKILFLVDASYRFAYDAVDEVLLAERNNRAQFRAVSPKIKAALDKVRPVVVDIDHRWALARAAYQNSPTPENLTSIRGILQEMQNLVPVVLSQMNLK